MNKPTFRDRLEYAGLMPLVWLLRLLPARAALWLSARLGEFAFDVVRFRRAVAMENLRSRLGGTYSGPELRDIGRRCYRQFAMACAELARLPLVDSDYVKENIEIEGAEQLDKALTGGRGAVLVTGHFGSYELMGAVLVMMGYPITFAVGVQRNPLVQRLMNHLRHSAGIGTVEAQSVLSLARTVRSNQFVAMLSDQDAGSRGIFVDFMGKPASTPQGAARLSLLARAPVITGFITRLGATRQRISLGPTFYYDASLGKREAVSRITRDFTAAIESRVRERPDHWLWGHRRWKSRPG